ncbi:MAG: metal ABC transporter ATP-binding protein [Lachnospiraceae bacterium]|nr:metal ABC transporter ATP-binding protein [Lachnospiraceae bacterium]
MSEIICRDLTLGYENSILVQGLSFDIHSGDYLCIVGENGAGKSTLMKTILHLQKPISGDITYGDGLVPSEIGYLPQQTVVQKDFPASVWEVILSGRQSRLGKRPFYSHADKKEAMSNMERLGIADLKGRCYRELSGGQQQRVLLARALSATSRMILLDEPVSGLDPMATLEMYQIIQKLNKEGITVVMISHDIFSSVRYASHILHIGEEVFYGTVEEYADSSIGKRYLESGGMSEKCDHEDGDRGIEHSSERSLQGNAEDENGKA